MDLVISSDCLKGRVIPWDKLCDKWDKLCDNNLPELSRATVAIGRSLETDGRVSDPVVVGRLGVGGEMSGDSCYQ